MSLTAKSQNHTQGFDDRMIILQQHVLVTSVHSWDHSIGPEFSLNETLWKISAHPAFSNDCLSTTTFANLMYQRTKQLRILEQYPSWYWWRISGELQTTEACYSWCVGYNVCRIFSSCLSSYVADFMRS